MHKKILRKILIIGIVVLLVGIAFLPSLTAITLNTTDSNHLSETQVGEIDIIFNNMKRKLDDVDTKEDCNTIFKETLIELDKYGLLKGISAVDAYKKITSGSDNPYSVYGESTANIYFLENTGLFFHELSKKYGPWLSSICEFISHLFLVSNRNPLIHTGSYIYFGELYYVRYYLYDTYPADGYINIVSPEGETEYNGSFYGHIGFKEILDIQNPMGGHYFYCLGIKGFKGILINNYYFGTAMDVNISNYIPNPYE
jgi:hypothetical protein